MVINSDSQETRPSCDGRMSRHEFLKKLIAPTAIVGAMLVAPKVVDKFVLPAQAAPPTSLKTKGINTGGSWPRRR
jgi:hypothetical protein